MARIPEEIIEQVLAATDIVDVVGRVVKLRRAGTNFVGLCPFHNEKTPSFNVSPSRNGYHCFGCGAGGTPIRFLMEHDGLTFGEAVKRLADAAGILIPEQELDAESERNARIRGALVKVHQQALEFYHGLLMKDAVGEPARAYLKSRGIGAEVARNWQLGYAPARPDLMRKWAAERKFTDNLLVAAGIYKRGERGDVYAGFRDRLMFPIRNDHGDVVAFSGRLLDANAKAAKYLNSPETMIFSKSRILFGFDKSKRAIAKAGRAVVCEGQIDLIMAFEAGFENVVAALGTAFTEQHARLLKRHADEVVLCYDSDTAGFKAAQRSFQILAPSGLIVKMAALPTGDDPDTLIRRDGAEAFARLIEEAQDFTDYQIDHAARQPDFQELRVRVRFAEQMAVNIRALESPVARSTAIQRVALRLGIPEEDIRRQVARGGGPTKGGADAAAAPPQAAGDKLMSEQNRTALTLCAQALAQPEVMRWLRAKTDLQLLADVNGTELLTVVARSRFEPGDMAGYGAFLAGLPPEQEQALTQLSSRKAPPGGEEEARQAWRALERERLQHLIRSTQTQLKQPDLTPEKAADLQRRLLGLRKEYLDHQRPPPDTA
ncbi:MAG: DNA primase [Verrucomicrobiales bacterium]|nr:DNA primase [Verrucomicrobiales bacterium]